MPTCVRNSPSRAVIGDDARHRAIGKGLETEIGDPIRSPHTWQRRDEIPPKANFFA
jgi:hypothetical protein